MAAVHEFDQPAPEGLSQLPAVIGPVQQSLPLPSAAPQITGLARKLKLTHVTADGFPAFDLTSVLVPVVEGDFSRLC